MLGGVVIVVGPELLPLLPAAILYINLATDGLPALALGLSPPDRDIMQRPPRDPTESIFTRDVRLLVLLGVLVECPIFLWIYFDSIADIELARTRLFLLFIFIELIISVCFVSLRFSLLQARPHKWLLLAMAWELALFGVLIQFDVVRETFGIGMPDRSDLAIALAVSAFVVAAIEATKAYLRASARRSVASPASIPQQVAGGNAMQKVLIPVGGTRNDRFAVETVIRRFVNNTAMEVHLLNVQIPFSAYVAQFSSRSNRRDYHRERAEAALAPAKEMLDKFSIPYAVHMEVGDRARVITDVARRLALRWNRDGDGAQELPHATGRELGHRKGDRAHDRARRSHRRRLDVEVGTLRHSGRDRRRTSDGARDRGLTPTSNAGDQHYPRGSPSPLTAIVGPGGAVICTRCSMPRKL